MKCSMRALNSATSPNLTRKPLYQSVIVSLANPFGVPITGTPSHIASTATRPPGSYSECVSNTDVLRRTVLNP